MRTNGARADRLRFRIGRLMYDHGVARGGEVRTASAAPSARSIAFAATIRGV